MTTLVLSLVTAAFLALVIIAARKEINRIDDESLDEWSRMRVKEEIRQIINKRPHHLVRDNNQACEDMRREESHD